MARYVYVGTYTAPDVPPGGTHPSTAVGIHVFKMDPQHGGLTPVQVVTASNPSSLALNPTLTRLYSVNEDLAGGVSAYAIDPGTGELSFVNSASANGEHTTHLSVHPSGQYLMAANYTSGNAPVFRLDADGSIGAMTANFQGVGNGPNADRQEGPHAHQILTDPAALHVFEVDLGTDRIHVLSLDPRNGALNTGTASHAAIAPGSGPRHMAFHPNRQRAYVLNELSSTIDVFGFDEARGAMRSMQTLSTLPPDFAGSSSPGEIRVHPSGRFVYSTNRGHDSIASFRVDERSGQLESLGWEPTSGQWPRGMNIDPSGSFLYAANQNTDTIVVFEITSDGALHKTGAIVNTPTPVDIAFGAPV